MECNIKIVKLKQVLPLGTFPKREHNVRFFYHRTDGCYYMYDEKGCEINLTTDGNIIAIDRELIVGSESLTDDTLVCIGLKANYVHPSRGIRNNTCGCQDTYIRAWTYIKDLQDFMQSGHIERDYYRVTLVPSPEEGGIVGCSGSAIVPDENSDGFRFQFEAGSRVELYAKPVQGYHFKGWKEFHTNEIMSISPNWSFTIKKDMDLIGVFEKDEAPIEQFYINVNADPANAGYVVGAGTFPKGTRHSITAAAIQGYHFTHWTDSLNRIVSTNLQYDLVVEKDETYTAHFELDTPVIEEYNVTIITNPADKGSVSGGGTYKSGQTAIIVPSPVEGWAVDTVTASGGNLVDNGNGTYSIVVTRDLTITVNFKEAIRYFTFSVVADANGLVRYKDINDAWSQWAERHEVTAPEKTIVTIAGKANGGYEFEKWVTPTGANLPNNENNIIVEEGLHRKVYTAYFKETYIPPETHIVNITAGSNGKCKYKIGSGEYSEAASSHFNISITDGETIEVLGVPDSGYSFEQWNIGGTTSNSNPYSKVITENVDFSCTFVEIPPEEVTITVGSDGTNETRYRIGDSSWSNWSTSEHTFKTAVGSIYSVEARAVGNYKFREWNTSGAKVSDNPATFTAKTGTNATHIAMFDQVIMRTLTLTAGTGGKCRAKINGSWSDYYSGTKTYSDIVDGTTVSVEALADSGYHFKEWTDSGAPSTTSRDIVMNDSKSIEARFEVDAPDKFQVTYEAIPNGSATMEGAGTYNDGDTCTIKVNVSPGYTLNKVLVDGVKITLNSNNQYSFVVEKNIKVTIECDLIPEPTHYTLTVKTEDEGVAQGGVGINKESNLGVETAEFEDGTVATIHATAAEGYSFGGWWKDGVKVSDDVTLSVTIDADKTYIAKFTQVIMRTLTLTAGTGGKCRAKINGSWSDYYSGTKTYSDIVDGTTVSVEALADSGYHFKEWTDSGAPSTTSRDIVMNDSKSIEARFEVDAPDKFQVTYEAIPNGSATMEGAGTYNDGDTCTIKVNVSPGYTLNKVLVDGVKITLNSNNQYSFVVEKNIKVTIECDLIPEPTHYTLTVKTEDEGVAQGGVGINKESNLGVETAEFEDGTVATIHATAAEGYSFGGWWKDGVKVSDDVTLSVTIDADKTYIAKFTQDPYLELDKPYLIFEATGGTQTVNVTSNVEWTVS